MIGGARSQSPACGAAAARSLALSRGPLAFFSSSTWIFLVMTLSHSFFMCRSNLGISVLDSVIIIIIIIIIIITQIYIA